MRFQIPADEIQLPKNTEKGGFQARRLQCRTRKCGQATTTLPSGNFEIFLKAYTPDDCDDSTDPRRSHEFSRQRVIRLYSLYVPPCARERGARSGFLSFHSTLIKRTSRSHLRLDLFSRIQLLAKSCIYARYSCIHFDATSIFRFSRNVYFSYTWVKIIPRLFNFLAPRSRSAILSLKRSINLFRFFFPFFFFSNARKEEEEKRFSHFFFFLHPFICSPGYFHDAGRRAMEMDSSGVLDELLALVARFRPDLVADRLQPRRPRSGESRQLQLDLHPLHREHSWIHQLVPLLDRDPAHDRVTNYPSKTRRRVPPDFLSFRILEKRRKGNAFGKQYIYKYTLFPSINQLTPFDPDSSVIFFFERTMERGE